MRCIRTWALCALLASAAAAQAAVTFSDVAIGGSLSAGASFVTNATDIDFTLPNATVGDPVDPVRAGTITITFIAEDPSGLDRDLLSILGGLSGSGIIFFNEVVEDLVNPGIIASTNVVADENGDLPVTETIFFSRTSTRVKVKKTVVLAAIDTDDFDLASVSLIEQKLIPEPASIAMLLIGSVAAAFRRR
ncbi:MAG: PEP-CTERM sorting domain-containing protein [Phycisphaerales bacterium]|nr:PEP-CTERM sorting domain-containing protein [Phycisphaerales bacterium]